CGSGIFTGGTCTGASRRTAATTADAGARVGGRRTGREDLLAAGARPVGRADRALSGRAARAGVDGVDVSARSRRRRTLGQGESGAQGQGARGRIAAAILGSERQVACGVPTGVDDDERETRLDAKTR